MTSRTRRNQARATDRSVSDSIDSAILWITLGILFIIPLIFSFSGFLSGFNELKIVTLHLGAGAIAILWLWRAAISKVNDTSANAYEKVVDHHPLGPDFAWIFTNGQKEIV